MSTARHGYEPTYEVLTGKEKTVNELKKAAKGAENVYLAADPDREGEAISWHLQETLKPGAKKTIFRRVRFNEITKKAVLAAMENAGEIDGRLVDAQQARRIIDRLVGYEVSDLLWKKVWRGLSAGRVQTVALRIICERETRDRGVRPGRVLDRRRRSSRARVPPPFTARLSSFDGEKLKFDGTDPRLAGRGRGDAGARGRREGRLDGRAPSRPPSAARTRAPPFITSQLQQAAARRLGFAVRRTMQIAQRLYEGREIPGRGTVGLITYMRTDSTRVSDDALTAVRELIERAVRAGVPARVPALLQEPPGHAGRARGDPPDVPRPAARRGRQVRRARRGEALPPDLGALRRLADDARGLRHDLRRDRGGQGRLPRLRLDAQVRRATSRPTGSRRRRKRTTDKDSPKLPPLKQGETLKLLALTPEQKETQPPPRFNEASLVKFLEENGIGRPSTYAEILRKLEERRYVHKKDRRFIPTALGRTVIELLIPYFDDFFETAYTARMEEALDEVEEGKLSWTKALSEFDKTFTRDRNRALDKMVSGKAGIPLAQAKKLNLSGRARHGREVPELRQEAEAPHGQERPLHRVQRIPGLHLHAGHPRSRGGRRRHVGDREDDVRRVRRADEGAPEPDRLDVPRLHARTRSAATSSTSPSRAARPRRSPTSRRGEMCPRCGHALVRRHGRYGAYVSCSNYPACKYKPPKPVKDTGVRCPKDGGIIAERRGRFRPFYGCVNYPNCDFSLSVRPIPEKCPQCGNPYLLLRERKSGNVFACDKVGCGFEKPAGEMPPIVEFTPEAPPEVPGGGHRGGGEGGRRRPAPRAKPTRRKEKKAS